MNESEILRTDLKLRRHVTFAFGSTTIPGTQTIEARHFKYGVPMATIWFRMVGRSTIEIEDCYTPEFARRCGLFTWLFEKMVLNNSCPITHVVTENATKFSEPILRSIGFKRDPSSGDLLFVVPRKRMK